MKVVLSMAVSLNGMVAREDGQEDWLPSEGWDEFVEDVGSFRNFIMGRETFELVQSLYPDYNFDNVESNLKIIVTRNQDYEAPTGYIVAHSPQDALDILKANSIDAALLIGEGKLNSQFLAQKLVDEVWLTYNPHILGKGRSFIHSEDLDINLSLQSCSQLSLGRIHAKYAVKE